MIGRWWERFWFRALTWAFHVDAPLIHGGNLAIIPPTPRKAPLWADTPGVRGVPPIHCRARAFAIQVRRCTTHRLPPPFARVRAVCAPSLRIRQFQAPLAIAVQWRKLASVRVTLPATHHVLVCRGQPAVRARVRLLPKRVAAAQARVTWNCRARRITPGRFQCQSVRSSLAWQLLITRRALAFRSLPEERRRVCQEALQRAAQGYVQVRSVYYPVPAHSVARIEVDERRGVLYIHPGRGRLDAAPACLWVISGVQLLDGRPVRAVLREA